jgi:hypothetical protein
MPDPTPTPAVPAVVPVTPEAPPVAPPVPEPKKSSLLSNILDLVAPEKVDVKPVVPPVVVAPEVPAAVVAPEPTPAPAPEPKKVPVKKKEAAPAGPTADEVRAIAAEEAAKAAKPAAPEPAAPDDSSLTPEEAEELELARLAEKKDPSKKGLADKFRGYYKAQAEFLERRMAAEGDDYDPTTDPEFKRFAAKNEPKLTISERKSLRDEKVASAAEARALEAADKRYAPEIEKLRMKTLELEHQPQIRERVGKYAGEIAEGMPEDIVKFYNENGRDIAKTKEAFPGEFEIVVQSVNGATALGEEALSLRRGLKKFNAADPKHQYLDTFLKSKADHLLTRPSAEQSRDGKSFVHPYEWRPEMAGKHWTFDDEDVLGMLKAVAQKEAKDRVSARRSELKSHYEAMTRRTAAPSGAIPPVVPVAPPSTRTPPVVAPGAAAPAGKNPSRLSGLLGLS